MSNAHIENDSEKRNHTRYRVSFCGVFPSLLPSGDERHTYTRLCESREKAEALFREEPSAYQIDRWEPEIKSWVLLECRDKLRVARVYPVRHHG